MYYAILCEDVADSLPLRASARPASSLGTGTRRNDVPSRSARRRARAAAPSLPVT